MQKRNFVFVLTMFALAFSAFSQQLKVEEIALPTTAYPGIGNLETDKDDLLWIASYRNEAVGTTFLTQTSATGGLTLVGKSDGLFDEGLVGNTLDVIMGSFLPQSGDGSSFAIGGYISAGNGLKGKDYEFVVTKKPASVIQSCKDYTVAGISLLASVNLVGPAFDAKGQKFYTGSDGASSTIYQRGTASNGVCSLIPKGTISGIVIKVVPLPDGGFLFEEVLSVSPASFTKLTAQFGVLKKDGSVNMLVSPNVSTNPRFISASGGYLAVDLVKQVAMISWLGKDGGQAVLYDMLSGTVEEIPLPAGMSTSYISAQSIRGAWAAMRVNGNEGWRILVFNRDTKHFWSVGSTNTKLPGMLEFVFLGAVTTRGTVFFTAADGQFKSRIFQADLVGVTGWPKPTVTFTADTASVNPGEPVRLSWTSTDASFVNVNVPGDFATTGDYAVTGTKVFYPTGSTTVRAFARGPGGDSNTATVNITVKPLVPLPEIKAVTTLFGGMTAVVTDTVTPGQIVTLWGNLYNGDPVAMSIPLPTQYKGFSVDFVDASGKTVQGNLYYVSQTQVNLQVPDSLPLGTYKMVARMNSLASIAVTLKMISTNPNYLQQVVGTKNFIKAVHQNGSIVDANNPVMRGELILIFLTGLGKNTLATIEVDGVSAKVEYAGPGGGYPGLDQMNVVMPDAMGVGVATVTITVEATDGDHRTDSLLLQTQQ